MDDSTPRQVYTEFIEVLRVNCTVNITLVHGELVEPLPNRPSHIFPLEKQLIKVIKFIKVKPFLKLHKINLFILFILVVVTYSNALNNAFVSDDIAEIRNNPFIGDLGYAISSHPFGFIRLILYFLAYHIGDLNPSFFRLINIGFHLGSTLLIYIILNLLYTKRLALTVAAIFAVHPAISEAVVWISGGMYAQYTFFFLLSFVFYNLSTAKISSSAYIISRKFNKKYYLLSVICFLLSLMSHPVMPAPLFIIFPLFESVFGDLKKNWLKVVPFLILSSAYVFINLAALPERTTTLQSVHYQERGVDNIFILIPVAISSYFQLIFWPKTLTLYHSELAFSQIEFLIRVLLTLVFFVSVAVSYFKNRKIFFWLTFFLISLSPTLTPFRFNWVVAERYLYLPSLGILTVLALGFIKLGRRYRSLDYALLAIILVLLSARTIIRNIDWKNEDSLWIATGKTSPSSPNTHNNLGDVYGRQGDKQRALQEFQTAIQIKPNYADAYHNLANTYRELGDVDRALQNYQKAIFYNPNLWQSYQNIAALNFAQKEYDKALEAIQKAIQASPKNINLRANLGIIFLVKGDKTKAKETFEAILRVDPQNQLAKQGLIEASK